MTAATWIYVDGKRYTCPSSSIQEKIDNILYCKVYRKLYIIKYFSFGNEHNVLN